MSYVQIPFSLSQIYFPEELAWRLEKYWKERGFIWFKEEVYLMIKGLYGQKILVTCIDSTNLNLNLKQDKHLNPFISIPEITNNVYHDGWTVETSMVPHYPNLILSNRSSIFDSEGYAYAEYANKWIVHVNGISKHIDNPKHRKQGGRLVKMNDKFYCVASPEMPAYRSVYVISETVQDSKWKRFNLPFNIADNSWVITSQEWFIGIGWTDEKDYKKEKQLRFIIMDLSHPNLFSYPYPDPDPNPECSRIICDELLSWHNQIYESILAVLFLCKDDHNQDKDILYLAFHGAQSYWRFIIPNV